VSATRKGTAHSLYLELVGLGIDVSTGHVPELDLTCSEIAGLIRRIREREIWADRGGDPRHIWPAVRRIGCELVRLPEYGNHLFVFPPKRCGGAA